MLLSKSMTRRRGSHCFPSVRCSTWNLYSNNFKSGDDDDDDDVDDDDDDAVFWLPD